MQGEIQPFELKLEHGCQSVAFTFQNDGVTLHGVDQLGSGLSQGGSVAKCLHSQVGTFYGQGEGWRFAFVVGSGEEGRPGWDIGQGSKTKVSKAVLLNWRGPVDHLCTGFDGGKADLPLRGGQVTAEKGVAGLGE